MWHCLIFYLKKSSHAKVLKNHVRKREIETKGGKCTKQCNHKYEICLWEMI